MNNSSLPARWPAPGNLSEGRAFVLKEDVIFTPLGQPATGLGWHLGRPCRWLAEQQKIPTAQNAPVALVFPGFFCPAGSGTAA